MVFLKFLSKKPRRLDIPPPPPALDIPPPPEDFNLPELPPLPGEQDDYVNFDFNQKKNFSEPAYNESEANEEVASIKPASFMPQQKKIDEPKEKHIKEFKKEVFLKVDQYKNAIEDIVVAKQRINESERIVERLNEIKNMKDKEFEKWRNLMEDIERKFVYIDKTFFER